MRLILLDIFSHRHGVTDRSTGVSTLNKLIEMESQTFNTR